MNLDGEELIVRRASLSEYVETGRPTGIPLLHQGDRTLLAEPGSPYRASFEIGVEVSAG